MKKRRAGSPKKTDLPRLDLQREGVDRRRPILALVVLLIYALPIAGRYSNKNPNELSRLLLTAAVAREGHLHVDGPMSVYGRPMDRAERAGRTYSDKAPGMSLISVPAFFPLDLVLPDDPRGGLPEYWLLRHWMTVLVVALPAAWLPFWMLKNYPALEPRGRMSMAMLFAVVTPMWTYSTVFFSHVPAGVLAAAAYVMALRPGEDGKQPSWMIGGVCGVLAGFAATTEYATILIGGVIFIALWGRRSGWRVLAAYVAGGLAGVLPALLYHQAAFGSMWTTGYSFKGYAQHAAVHAQGISGVSWPTAKAWWGVLFGSQRGLLYYCPMLWLVLPGIWWMWKERRRDAWPLALVCLIYMLFGSGFVDWRGGWCAAARHLVPVVPLLVYPIATAVERLGKWVAGRGVVAALAGVSGCAAILSIAISPFFPTQIESPLRRMVLESLAEGEAFDNAVSAVTGVSRMVVLAAMAAVIFALIGLCLAEMFSPWRRSGVTKEPRSAGQGPHRMWFYGAGTIGVAGIYVLLLWTAVSGGSEREERWRRDVLRRLGRETAVSEPGE